MKHADIIIIGAGPAGLLSAYAAGPKALVLEGNPYSGKKLLLSGNGQCNFSNNLDKDSFLKALRDAAHYLKPALYAFDQKAFTKLLKTHGCPASKDKGHKLFPTDRHSASVRNALLSAVQTSGAQVVYNTKVLNVSRDRSGGFKLETSTETYHCNKLILATGGQSYPQTGSDGSSYRFAKALGHKIIPPRPALASVELDRSSYSGSCAGLSLPQVMVSMCTDQGRLTMQGDLLLTHKGLSGPVILNNSYLIKPGTYIAICLIPDAEEKINQLTQLHTKKQLQTALKHLNMAECLIAAILKRLELDGSKIMAELKASERKLLSNFLSNAVFTVNKVESFETAMATAGGINLKDINSRTLESRICPGLYLTGELLNYHAPTGGFNIQLAASTGWLAGKSAASSPE